MQRRDGAKVLRPRQLLTQQRLRMLHVDRYSNSHSYVIRGYVLEAHGFRVRQMLQKTARVLFTGP